MGHGPPMDNWLEQTTTFTDSSCAEKGGSNLCLDIGHVAFPNSEKYTQTIGHFPTFHLVASQVEAVQLKKKLFSFQKMSTESQIWFGLSVLEMPSKSSHDLFYLRL